MKVFTSAAFSGGCGGAAAFDIRMLAMCQKNKKKSWLLLFFFLLSLLWVLDFL